MINCYKNKVDILAFKWTGKNKKDVKIIKNKLKKYPEYKLKILKDDILCISTLSLSVNGVMDYEELYDLQDEEDNEDVIDFFS